MEIVLNIDDLRTMAVFSSEAAGKMDDANNLMKTIVSKHDWKCPERKEIDNTIERLQNNSMAINKAFLGFSNDLVRMANGYSDYANMRDREEATYMEDVMSRLSSYCSGRVPNTITTGSNTKEVVTALESASSEFSNIASLHGASHGINIMDFSLFNK